MSGIGPGPMQPMKRALGRASSLSSGKPLGETRTRLSAFAQQGPEARLNEMAIGGERLLQAALLHDEEGNAIDQRPCLVGTSGEQVQALSKQRGRTRHVDRGWIAEKFIDK